MSTTITSSPSPINTITSFLGSRLRLSLTDGRTLTGRFTCVDHQGNLVLDSATERAPEATEEREVGLVLIPQKHWNTVERELPVEGKVKEGCVPV